MKISRATFNNMSKEELVIWINQKLNEDHLSEVEAIDNDKVYNNWTIKYVLANKTHVLNKSLIKIID